MSNVYYMVFPTLGILDGEKGSTKICDLHLREMHFLRKLYTKNVIFLDAFQMFPAGGGRGAGVLYESSP